MIFMELFGLTKYGSETGNHSNFRDYGNALLLLIRITTGEAWVGAERVFVQEDIANFTFSKKECDNDGLYSAATELRLL